MMLLLRLLLAYISLLVMLSGCTGSISDFVAGALPSTSNDNSVPVISITSVTVNETATQADLTVSISKAALAPITVSYATVDGTAEAGSDYTSTTGSLNWATGQSDSRIITVPLTDDVTIEGNETFTVELTVTLGTATLATPAGGVVTITDNDGPPAMSIVRKVGQAASTNELPIEFTVTFSKEIDPSSFTAGDVSNTGTATGITWNVSQDSTFVYTLSATASLPGTLTPEIAAGSIEDLFAVVNVAAATSTESVTYTPVSITNVSSATANGSYKAGDVIAVDVTFSGIVTVDITGGTPSIDMELTPTGRSAVFFGGSGTSVLTFHYTVQATDTSADLDYVATSSLVLNSGTILDVYGEPTYNVLPAPGAAGSLSANKNLVIDTTPPGLFGIAGARGGTDVASNAYLTSGNLVTATWAASAGATRFEVTIRNAADTADVCPVQSSVTSSFAFSSCPLVEGTSYKIQVVAFDAAGNSRAASNNNYDFKVDTTAPTLTFAKETSQAASTSTLPIEFTATFSEDIQVASFTAADISNTGTATGITWSIASVSGSEYTVSATAITGAGTLIPRIAINSVFDLAGFSNAAAVTSSDTITYIADGTPPDPVNSVTLSSDAFGGISESTTISPDLIINAPGTDIGSGVASFDYRLIRTSDSTVIVDWTNFGAGVSITTRFTGLTLVDGETYKFVIRVKDGGGNNSSTVDSSTFTIDVETTPYDGLGLADPTTLGDLNLSSATIDGATYTRNAPREGKIITLSGANTWSNRAAIFLRADELALGTDAVIRASGTNGTAFSGGTGGAGGSGGSGGGGGGANGVSTGGPGGSGANGSVGGAACCGTGGSAGTGTGSTYNVGFTYGSGGAGGAGLAGALGGAAGNAFGGGGGGGNGTGSGAGDGAGAGGGLVVIVANSITGTGLVQARGGAGADSGVSRVGGGGGGGVIWVAARSYTANLQANVAGGAGGNYGADGLAKIFQINSDGSLTRRSFDESWGVDSVATSSLLPFSEALADVSALGDSTLSNTTIDSTIYHAGNPYSARNLTISGTLSPTSSATALFLRADVLTLGASTIISANGSDGVTTTNNHGGHGGSGGSGGGGGSSSSGLAIGGLGGSGINGLSGNYGGAGTIGVGGAGTWKTYYNGFDYGNGGAGGASDARFNPAAGGAGLSGAGGGGGGLIVIVANTVNGAATVKAIGGAGGLHSPTRASGGGGGGGAIWIAAKSYSGNITADVRGGLGGPGAADGAAGSVRIFQLFSDGSLIARQANQSWTLDSAATTNNLPYTFDIVADLPNLGDAALSDGSTLDASTYSKVNPYSADLLEVFGVVTPAASTPHAIFLAANHLQLNAGAILRANGANAVGVTTGGSGGSGGGGGSVCNAGGAGGSGKDGLAEGNTQGFGSAFQYNAGFTYGTGGAGGAAFDTTPFQGVSGSMTVAYSGGSGVNGAGGGGGGGRSCTGTVGGGGGGGGLVVIVANTISGMGIIEAYGGDGGRGSAGFGGGGGGGVVWIAAKNYSGNILANVGGGFGGVDGSSGEVKIYQIYSNGNIVQRSLTDSWTLDAAPVTNQIPFSQDVWANRNFSNDDVFSNEDIDASFHSLGNPFVAANLTIDGIVKPLLPGPTGLFLVARNISFNGGSVLSANGQNGSGTTGGSGGSGGGSGTGCGQAGAGGSGRQGHGQLTVGLGFGFIASAGFNFGNGGAGGNGGSLSGGAGGIGFGGGGGTQAGCSGTNGAGGGGGGLIVIVAESMTGPGDIRATGGNGATDGTAGGGGGGGVIWIAVQSYDGASTATVSGGTGLNAGGSGSAQIFQLNLDGTLTPRAFTDSW